MYEEQARAHWGESDASETAPTTDAPHRWSDRIEEIIRKRIRFRVAKWANRRIATMDEEDLLQEVAVCLLDRGTLVRFMSDAGTLEAFLGTCTTNIIKDIERKELNRLRLAGEPAPLDMAPPQVADESPEVDAIVLDLYSKLQAHLKESLSDEEWLLFQRIYLDELTKEEVMSLDGISLARYYRVRHKIRRLAKAFLRAKSP